MDTNERIQELEEKRDEFIINESVFEDDHPSWGELAEAQIEAGRKWDETDDGKELKALRDANWNEIDWEKVYSVINNANGDLVPEDFTGTWEDVVHANLPKENGKKYHVWHGGEYAVAEYDDTDCTPGFCMEKDEFMFEPEAWAEIE